MLYYMLNVKFAYPSCLQHRSIISKNMILEVAQSIILNLRQNRQYLFENNSKIKLNKENLNVISVMTLIINSYCFKCKSIEKLEKIPIMRRLILLWFQKSMFLILSLILEFIMTFEQKFGSRQNIILRQTTCILYLFLHASFQPSSCLNFPIASISEQFLYTVLLNISCLQ